MRKNIFFALLLCVAPCCLQAQIYSTTFHVNSCSYQWNDEAIVRSWDEDHLVVYFKDSLAATQCISIVDVTGFTAGTPITPIETRFIFSPFSIRDMRIVNVNHYSYTPGLLPASIVKDCEM